MDEKSRHKPMRELEVYKRFVTLADEVWKLANDWDHFAKRTVGIQLATAADSVGSNLVEGDARHGGPDAVKFFVYARASAAETRYWLERAMERKLLPPDLNLAFLERVEEASQMLNGLITYRRRFISEHGTGGVRETIEDYDA
jgi:four helix bundle protein